MSDFAIMRKNMVIGQLIPENVIDPLILQAFATLPREQFVPRQLSHIAYMDDHFPLMGDRSLLRPALLGRLLQALCPTSEDKILYVASGSGYGPALLNQLGVQVVALESEEILSQEAERLTQELKLSFVEIVWGPLHEGWETEAPYDKMIIEGTVDFIPESLLHQLKEGGTIATLKMTKEKGAKAVLYTKTGLDLGETYLFDVFSPLTKVFKKHRPFIF